MICFERVGGGHGIVVRLPFGCGVSFWPPAYAVLFGVYLNDGCLAWHIGPFGGEMWRKAQRKSL